MLELMELPKVVQPSEPADSGDKGSMDMFFFMGMPQGVDESLGGGRLRNAGVFAVKSDRRGVGSVGLC